MCWSYPMKPPRRKGTNKTDRKSSKKHENKCWKRKKARENEKRLAAEQQSRLQKEIEEQIANEGKTAEKLAPNAAGVALGVISFGIVPADLRKVS